MDAASALVSIHKCTYKCIFTGVLGTDQRRGISLLYNVLERPSSRQKIPFTKLPPDGPTWMIASHTHGEYDGTALRVSESSSCVTVYCPQIAQSPQTFAWCMKIHIFYIYLHGVSLQRWENLYTRDGGLPLHSRVHPHVAVQQLCKYSYVALAKNAQ